MTIGRPAPILVSKVAGADLSSSQWMGVNLNASGQVITPAATTDPVYGILQNTPVTNETAQVAPVNGGGSTYIYLSGTIASGALVTVDGDGKATADVATGFNIGQLEAGGAVGELGVLRLGNLTQKA